MLFSLLLGILHNSKSLHSWFIEHGEIKLALTWKVSLLGSFHSAGKCYTYYHGRKGIISLIKMWTLWATITICLLRFAHWCNSDMNVMGVTNYFLFGFKACSTIWNHRSYRYCGQEHGATAILQMGHSIKVTCNDFILHHRLNYLSNLIRKVSLWSGWWLKQSPTTG